MSKKQNSSFMYVTYCKLCPLSSIIAENVLDVCKPLQVMSFSPNSVNFLWLNLTKLTPHEVFWSFYSHRGPFGQISP
ncbi:hypothetical protein Hanom_Chr12g01172011 [Helianthus anomalus]